MKLTIDSENKRLTVSSSAGDRQVPLYSDEAFELLSEVWVKVGWNQKYSYTFSWLGRPIIQLPEDMLRFQEVVHRVRPTVIIETGVAHGGSLVYSASLLHLMGGAGRVIGVDIEIRSHNRQAIEAHALSRYITLVEGDSTDPVVVQAATANITPTDRVLVVLDSNHSYAHVRKELEAYHPFVALGSYIIATDGVMQDLSDVPRGDARWTRDNPARAATEFAASHPEFELEQPAWDFNESTLRRNVTHWLGAWLRRKG